MMTHIDQPPLEPAPDVTSWFDLPLITSQLALPYSWSGWLVFDKSPSIPPYTALYLSPSAPPMRPFQPLRKKWRSRLLPSR